MSSISNSTQNFSMHCSPIPCFEDMSFDILVSSHCNQWRWESALGTSYSPTNSPQNVEIWSRATCVWPILHQNVGRPSIIPHVQVYFSVSLQWAVWSQPLSKWGNRRIPHDFCHFLISPKIAGATKNSMMGYQSSIVLPQTIRNIPEPSIRAFWKP